MIFSSIPFLFLFLPLVLAGYFLLPGLKARNRWLLLASLVFYTWGGGIFALILLASITANYIFGLATGRAIDAGRTGQRNLWVACSVLVNIGLLAYYKYINFAIAQWNALAQNWGFAPPIAWESVALPIGISFFTFHCLSYVFDVAHGKFRAQRDYGVFALYVMLFPQLIAGPIVRYHDIATQFFDRPQGKAPFYEGMIRFLHGLAKKVILADSVGAVAESVFALPAGEMTTSLAWLGAFAYMLQIYFDFSAYSDMAIGLARMFGFTFPENFNRPYSAHSITDFWRRWHMTLSNWIREYLYIPLGGNRVSTRRMYGNLLTVFFLTGLWHGANWTFILWGLYHGALLVIERVSGQREHDNHILLRRALTCFLVLIGWVMFRAADVQQALNFYQHMFFAFDTGGKLPATVDAALSRRNTLAFVLASLVLCLPRHWRMAHFLHRTDRPALLYHGFLLLIALPYSLILIAGGTFSPFLYFQF